MMPKFFLSFILLVTSSILWSQKSQQTELEEQKAKIQREIRENESQLQQVKKKEKALTKIIVLQTDKIKLKEKLIATTEKQTQLLVNSMSVNQVQIQKLENELKLLKQDYAKMIVQSYKSRSEESRFMFILSSNSFLQAYKRLQYMKQYANYRKMQGQEIQAKTNTLYIFNAKLDVQKTAKQELITENNTERLSLEKEKQEQLKLAASLEKDKKKIIAAIKKKQKEAKTIDRKIDRLIREAIAEANRKAAREKAAREKAKADAIAKALEKKREIERANAAAAAKAKANAKPIPKPIPIPKDVEKTLSNKSTSEPINASATKMILTPEGKIDSDNFKLNKGKLPWPVEKGYISLGFGDQPHPVYKTLVIHNSGLEFTTDSGTSARAVFGGEVASVIVISPVNKVVMLQHGDFFTLYQNLSSVNVSKGDKINSKQSLGKIKTNGEGKTILKFAITQNTTYTNPKIWLVNR